MKNNLKKVLSGLALVALTTGCGLKDKDSSSVTNTSSVPSSSVSDSSSTGPVDTYEVTEAEWKEALDTSKMTNATANLDMSMKAVPLGVDYAWQQASGVGTFKIADNKAVMESQVSSYMEYDKEKTLAAMQAQLPTLTMDQLKATLQAQAEQYEYKFSETDTTFRLEMYSYGGKQYVAKANDVLLDMYEYEEDLEKYVSYRGFGDFSGVVADGLGDYFYTEHYAAAEYDETTKKYHLDTEALSRYLELGSGETVDVYYSFLNGKLIGLDFVNTYAEESVSVTESYTYTFSSYGSTSVTLPSGDEIYVCTHESTYESYNDEYHYTRCDDCYSVLTYEAHTMGDDDCTKCGYYPLEEEEKVIAGFNVTIRTNTHNNRVIEVYIEHDDWNWDETWTSKIYTSESTTNYVTETTVSEAVAGETCKIKDTTTYKFFDADGNEIADPIVVVDYHYEHTYELDGAYTYEEDGCNTKETYKCDLCGDEKVYEDTCHTHGEPVYGDHEGCVYEYAIYCSDCGELLESGTTEKHNLTFELVSEAVETEDDYIPATGTVTCSDCDFTYTGACSVYSMGSTHLVYMEIGSFAFEHDYDENGDCFCGNHKHIYDENDTCVKEDCGATQCAGGNHPAFYIEANWDGTFTLYCENDDCSYMVSCEVEIVDNGDGTHTITVTPEGEEAFSEVEDHNFVWGDCDCGAKAPADESEEA